MSIVYVTHLVMFKPLVEVSKMNYIAYNFKKRIITSQMNSFYFRKKKDFTYHIEIESRSNRLGWRATKD